MTGLMLGTVIFKVRVQNPAPSSVALSYRLRSTLCSAPSMVEIMKRQRHPEVEHKAGREGHGVGGQEVHFFKPQRRDPLC